MFFLTNQYDHISQLRDVISLNSEVLRQNMSSSAKIKAVILGLVCSALWGAGYTALVPALAKLSNYTINFIYACVMMLAGSLREPERDEVLQHLIPLDACRRQPHRSLCN